MVFSYTLDYKIPLSPAKKRETKSQRMTLVGGTFTNAGGDTGGAILTGADEILHISLTNNTSATGMYATLSGQTATIVTADGDDGTWEATIMNNNK